MNISAVIMAYNEEEQIPRLMESLKGIDDIVIVDHESTDKTAEVAELLGARVITRKLPTITPTQTDVDEFRKRFGFDPKFTTKDVFPDWLTELNHCLTYAKHDWVFWPDCDEIVTWNLSEIEKLLPTADQIGYTFIHGHNPDNSPSYEILQYKLFRKSVCRWECRMHSVLVGGSRRIRTEHMKVDHYQKPKATRSYLPQIEYGMLKDNNARSIYYLAREYYYNKRYNHALKFYKLYMKQAWYRPEIAEAWLTMAKCCWQLQQGDKARKYCLNAIAVNPDFKQALLTMSEYTGEGQKPYWKRYADIATNNGIIFIQHTI